MNPITAVERAIDFLAKPLAGLLRKEAGPCDATGTCESASRGTTSADRDAALLGKAALRTLRVLRDVTGSAFSTFWVSHIQSPDHDPGWYTRESAKHQRAADEQARTEIQRELRRRLGKDDA